MLLRHLFYAESSGSNLFPGGFSLPHRLNVVKLPAPGLLRGIGGEVSIRVNSVPKFLSERPSLKPITPLHKIMC